MKTVLLIGIGRFGLYCAKKFSEMNHEVMAIDTDEDRINEVLPFVTNAKIGNSTNELFLDSLGVSNYDVCIVTIADSFQNSLETVSLLKDRGAKKVVARAASAIHAKFLRRNGADHVIFPEKQLAEWTALRCSSDNVLDYINLEGDSAIFEIKIPNDWIGKSISKLDVRRKYDINILGVRRNEILSVNFSPDIVLESTDSIFIIGDENEIRKKLKI